MGSTRAGRSPSSRPPGRSKIVRAATARNDVLPPTAFAIAAYEKAREPKRLVNLPGGHFDAYVKGFEASSGPALSWFREHLAP